MELGYVDVSETLEFFKSELAEFEEYFKYMPNTEEEDYITSVIKHYKVAILILEDTIK